MEKKSSEFIGTVLERLDQKSLKNLVVIRKACEANEAKGAKLAKK